MESEIVLAIEFVEYIPDELQERTLYISRKYGTAVHKCCCGCGREVVTPLSPTDWKLRVHGNSVSLYPSIGNWSMPCQSHYWIRKNRVIWAEKWSAERIARGRAYEAAVKDRYFGSATSPAGSEPLPTIEEREEPKVGFWERMKRWLFGG